MAESRRRSKVVSPPPRKLTPGQGRYTFVDTEEPTRPGVPKPSDRWDVVARLLANLSPEERRHFVILADDYYRCDADGRAILGAMAGKLAR